jgi:nucleoside-diphosphate-sugar epimerase
MSDAILVTGATGLVGANACRLARERGEHVRALARPGADVTGIEALGVEVVRGDLLDAAVVRAALDGCDRVVHAAAALSGTWSTATREEFVAINFRGTVTVLDAAAAATAPVRVCLLATTGFLARGDGGPITERTPVSRPRDGEMAYAATKRAAFLEGMRRAEAGAPVTAVFPGAIYGPSPVAARAVAPTSFNAAIVKAVRGELPRYPPVKLGWVLGEDVAAVALAALERGRAGERFLALGRQGDAMTIPDLLTRACRTAGVPHEVAATGSADEDPSLMEEFGAMARTAGTRWPEPLFDATATHERLGDRPTGLDAGLPRTLDWLRSVGAL